MKIARQSSSWVRTPPRAGPRAAPIVPAHAHQARPDVSEPRSAASTGMAPAEQQGRADALGAAGRQQEAERAGEARGQRRRGEHHQPGGGEHAGPDPPAHERDEQGRHRDDDGVGRQDPRDAHDAGVELPVQVGQRQHHDGGVGEGQAHGHHEERGEGGRAGSPAVVGRGGRGSRGGGDRGGQQGWRQRGAAREGGHEDLVDDGNRRRQRRPSSPRFPGRGPPLGEFGAPGRRKVAQRCVAGGPNRPGRLAAWPSRCALEPRPVGG